MVKESFGEQTASSVESVKSDHLPVILLVCKVGGKLEVQNIIQGNTDIESFMGHLLTCMEIHGEQVQRDNIEEVSVGMCVGACLFVFKDVCTQYHMCTRTHTHSTTQHSLYVRMYHRHTPYMCMYTADLLLCINGLHVVTRCTIDLC